jgi:DNA-binding transcriptional ArsR family regulator
MEFKIFLPENIMNNDDVERINRAMFNEDNKNGGIIAKVFIFCYLNQPIRVTEITERFNEYYKTDLDRAVMGRALSKLVLKHLVCVKGSGDVLATIPGEQTEMDKRIIEKYHGFINNIPAPFRRNYNNVNYYWVANGDGVKYIEWCCNLLNFKYEKK